jgi:hypothetical protein
MATLPYPFRILSKNTQEQARLDAIRERLAVPIRFLSQQDLQRIRERDLAYLEAGKLPPGWKIKPA